MRMPFIDNKKNRPSQVMLIKRHMNRKLSSDKILYTEKIIDMQKYKHRTMTGFGPSCGACKFLRRKCVADCVFAPYFCYEQAATHFAAVHKVFGASNVSRLLLHLPVHNRSDAAVTVSYEALARMHDPIYGCVAHIFALQQQVASLQEEIDTLENLMASSNVGADRGSSSLTPTNSNNGIELLLQHDATRTHYYQNQLSTLLSHEEGAAFYQSMDRQMGIDYSDANGFQAHLLGESNPNPLQTLLSGIDQEVFVNYPLFNVNAEIRN